MLSYLPLHSEVREHQQHELVQKWNKPTSKSYHRLDHNNLFPEPVSCTSSLTLQFNDRQQQLQECQQITGVVSHITYATHVFLFSRNWRLVCFHVRKIFRYFVSLPKADLFWGKGGKCLTDRRLSPPRCNGRVRKKEGRVGTGSDYGGSELARPSAGALSRCSNKSKIVFGCNGRVLI